MGMMLETTSTRLFAEPGRAALRLPGQGSGGAAAGARGRRPARDPVHHRDPGRHRRDARTSGPSRCFAIRRVARAVRRTCRRSSSRTSGPSPTPRCAARPTLGVEEYLATIAVARLRARPEDAHPGAAEPRRPDRAPRLLLRAGVDDWGGVSPLTPDHVNPERPWPQLDDLRRSTADCRVHAERAAHRPPASTCADAASRGSTRGCSRTSRALADPATGLAARGRCARRAAVAGARRRLAARRGHRRVDLHGDVDTDGRTGDRRSDFDEVYGDWDARARTPTGPHGPSRRSGWTRTSRRRWGARRGRPGGADRRRLPGPAHRRRRRPRRGGRARRRRCGGTRSATTSPTS